MGVPNDFDRGLTPEAIREMFDYQPDTGILTWSYPLGHEKMDGRGKNWGREAGHRGKDRKDGPGYCRVQIKGFGTFLRHRLIWVYMTGKWPASQIDHKNLVKGDDRWKNLREATNDQNQANRGLRPHNTSGKTGVSFHPSVGRWYAELSIGGVRVLHGYHDTEQLATAARDDALRQHKHFAYKDHDYVHA